MQEDIAGKTAELEEALSIVVSEEERLPLLNEISWLLRQANITKSRAYAQEAFTIAEKTGNGRQRALALRALGSAEDYFSNPQQALIYLDEAASFFRAVNDDANVIACNNLIGKTFLYLSDFPRALEVFQENQRLAQKEGKPQLIADALLTQGVVLLRSGDFRKAKTLLEKSKAISHESDYIAGEGRALLNLSALYVDLKQYEEGLRCALEGVSIMEKRRDMVDVASCISNAGSCCIGLGRYEEAETYFLRSREMRKANNEVTHLVNNSISMGELYTQMKRYGEAEKNLEEALSLCIDSGNNFQIMHTYEAFAGLCEAQGRYEDALKYYKLFHATERLLTNEESQKKMRNLEVRAEVERLENEKELYRKHASVLEEANRQISEQKDLIEEKNKDITDSIHYARRIQEALLPSEEEMKRLLPESFVFYRPKDIVSGDFYWVTEKDGRIFFAVADCTGHGVPGALMSMIGHNLLHRSINENGLSGPGEILSRLDHDLREMLKQNSADSGGNDGMDVVLIVKERGKNLIRFSSSRRPLWIFREGEMTEFKGERIYVGGKGEGFRSFRTNEFSCAAGDRLYLFSDGFPDQFGGPEMKKYQTARFRKFLQEIAVLPAHEQKELIEKEFFQWKGSNEQQDDILVAGIVV